MGRFWKRERVWAVAEGVRGRRLAVVLLDSSALAAGLGPWLVSRPYGIGQAPQQRAALVDERVRIRRIGAGAQAADQIDIRLVDEGAHEHRAAQQALGERCAVAVRREGMADGHRSQRELHGIKSGRRRFGGETAGAEDAAHLALALRAAEELRGAHPAAFLRLRAGVGCGGTGEAGKKPAARQALYRFPGRSVDDL